MSHLENSFLNLWNLLGSSDIPVREFAFAEPIGRKFRADFAWPDYGLLVEIEGGQHVNGRHNRASGYATDCEKYNIATILGYRVLRYTAKDIRERPSQIIAEVVAVMQSGGLRHV